MNRQTDRCMDRQTDRCMDEWKDKWIDWQMVRYKKNKLMSKQTIRQITG